ncbi:hypothetical protein SAMN04487972_10672 [Paracoccus halophilus]|uniref:Uncharacterized protein n=2 Tax=Paracoccus halophilus TaxID=376733 RepID=A0A1I0TAY1_9RHOB|nr:hypothetical protein SAMN04487972_10672 [Paracoccus halophilus]
MIAIALLAALAVILGLVVTGGPGRARMERHDDARMRDLEALDRQVVCLAHRDDDRLPRRLDPIPQCNWPVPLTDPYTGAPYRYEVTGPRSYRLCAGFELPVPPDRARWGWDEEGCIHRELHSAPAGRWVPRHPAGYRG